MIILKYYLKNNSKNNYNDLENVIDNVLKINGINDSYTYLNPTKDNEYNYSLLDNIDLDEIGSLSTSEFNAFIEFLQIFYSTWKKR